MNALMIATTDVGCKNLFAYAENNPVTNKDGSGNFVDTIFDVISLAGSIADVCKKPNDPHAWACLAGDAADVLIPGVAGIGEVIRGAKTVAIAAGAAEAAVGVAKGATKLGKKIDNLVDTTKSLGKKAAKSSNSADSLLPMNLQFFGGSSKGTNNFRNQDLFDSHYKKHVSEFGNISKEEYLKGANNLISNTSNDILTKTRANGDSIFYNSVTNEFAVKSVDDYIRTYFKPSDGIDYFNRQ